MRIFHISFLCLIFCLSFGFSVSAEDNISSEGISQNTTESETQNLDASVPQEDIGIIEENVNSDALQEENNPEDITPISEENPTEETISAGNNAENPSSADNSPSVGTQPETNNANNSDQNSGENTSDTEDNFETSENTSGETNTVLPKSGDTSGNIGTLDEPVSDATEGQLEDTLSMETLSQDIPLTITSPAEGDIVDLEFTITGKTLPNSQIRIIVNDNDWYWITTSNTDGEYIYDVYAEKGENIFEVQLIDAGENVLQTQTVKVQAAPVWILTPEYKWLGKIYPEGTKLTVTGKTLPNTEVSIFLNDEKVSEVMSDTEGKYEFIGTENLEQGQYQVYVTMKDMQGNLFYSDGRDFGVNIIRFLGHMEGNANNKDAYWMAASTLPNTEVQIFLNDTLFDTVQSDANGDIEMYISDLAPGNYTIYLTAIDSDTGMAFAKSVTRQFSFLQLVLEQFGQYSSGPETKIYFSGSKPYTQKVELVIDNTQVIPYLYHYGSTTFHFEVDLSYGAHTAIVYGIDDEGNRVLESEKKSFFLGNKEITFTNPACNTYDQRDIQLSFQGTTIPNSLVRVEAFLAHTNEHICSTDSQTFTKLPSESPLSTQEIDSNADGVFSGKFEDLGTGKYILVAYELDPTTKEIQSVSLVTINYEAKFPMPVITYPTYQVFPLGTNFQISGKTLPNTEVQIFLDYKKVAEVVSDTEGNYTFIGKQLKQGWHQTYVEIMDTHGNAVKSYGVGFGVNTVDLYGYTTIDTSQKDAYWMRVETLPNTEVQIFLNDTLFDTFISDGEGVIERYILDLTPGDYKIYAKAIDALSGMAFATSGTRDFIFGKVILEDVYRYSSWVPDTKLYFSGSKPYAQKVEIVIDDTQVLSYKQPSTSFYIETTLSPGKHTVIAYGVDDDGKRISESEKRSFFLGKQSGIVFTDPVCHNYKKDPQLSFQGTAHPESLLRVEIIPTSEILCTYVWYDDDNLTVIPAEEAVFTQELSSSADGTFSGQFENLETGKYTLVAYELEPTTKEIQGISRIVSFQYNPNSVPFSITSPADNEVVDDTQVQITGSANPEHFIYIEIYSLEDGVSDWKEIMSNADGVFTTTFADTSPGTYYLWVYDTETWEGVDSQFVVSMRIESPESGDVVATDSSSVEVYSTPDTEVQLLVNGEILKEGTTDSEGKYTFSVTHTAPGIYTIQAQDLDVFGIVRSQSKKIEIMKPSPNLSNQENSTGESGNGGGSQGGRIGFSPLPQKKATNTSPSETQKESTISNSAKQQKKSAGYSECQLVPSFSAICRTWEKNRLLKLQNQIRRQLEILNRYQKYRKVLDQKNGTGKQ